MTVEVKALSNNAARGFSKSQYIVQGIIQQCNDQITSYTAGFVRSSHAQLQF